MNARIPCPSVISWMSLQQHYISAISHSSSSSPAVPSSTFPSHSMPVYYGNYPLALRSMNHTFRTMTSDSFSVINSQKSRKHIAFEHIFLYNGPQWRSRRNLSDDHPANSYTHPRSSAISPLHITDPIIDWILFWVPDLLRDKTKNYPLQISTPYTGTFYHAWGRSNPSWRS